MWMDHNGCHLKDGQKATADSEGWFCNCCNMRVRRNPRNIDYKSKLRSSNLENDYEAHIDLSYFNKRRALMIKNIAQRIPSKKDDFDMQRFERLLLKSKISIDEIEAEFNESRYEIIDLAYTLDPPNKISMIVEFERIRDMIGEIPVKQDIDEHSAIRSSQYDAEFESWGHMLDRLGYDPFYRCKTRNNASANAEFDLEESDKSDENSNLTDVDRLNVLIDKSLRLIKSAQSGAYMSDIRMLLEISQEEMSRIATRIVRVDGISKNEILHDGILHDVLFKYDESVENNPSMHADEPKENPNTKPDDAEHDIKSLVIQMIDEYSTNRIDISKHLRQRLTKEFVESGSMETVAKNNPQFSEIQIMRHVRTSMRLPEKLREMENNGALHSDPECSLQIALFTVNYHKWNGDAKEQDVVIDLALSISKYLSQHLSINQIFRAKNRVHGNVTQSGTYRDKTHNTLISHHKSTGISTAVAVWIAVATLHRQYSTRYDFSSKEILLRIKEQDICDASKNTMAAHVSVHCVANNKPYPNKHRKLYRVSHGRYRLYRRGDYYNPERRNGQMEPDINELPDKYKDLIKWYQQEYCNAMT
jgi:hypothetical protein